MSVDLEPGELADAHPGVDEQAQDGLVAQVVEVLAGAGREQRPELVVAQHGDGHLGEHRRRHLRHRRDRDLLLARQPLEELLEVLIASERGARLVPFEQMRDVALDVTASDLGHVGRPPFGREEPGELARREGVLLDRARGAVRGSQVSLEGADQVRGGRRLCRPPSIPCSILDKYTLVERNATGYCALTCGNAGTAQRLLEPDALVLAAHAGGGGARRGRRRTARLMIAVDVSTSAAEHGRRASRTWSTAPTTATA